MRYDGEVMANAAPSLRKNGKYEIQSELGRGSFKSAYKAHDQDVKRMTPKAWTDNWSRRLVRYPQCSRLLESANDSGFPKTRMAGKRLVPCALAETRSDCESQARERNSWR
jgi:hypothetical protein